METAQVRQYSKEFLSGLMEKMLLIRRFEEKAAQMYGLQKIGGFCHLYIGQEASGVGSISAADLSRDFILTAYRDHGIALACGMKPGHLMAELFAKASGCSKGKGGSMHFFDSSLHFLGGNGIVGAHIPVATGVAFKIHLKKESGVVLCFFGDGAIHQGSFHESLNMAQIWKLPILYICENNQYGMGTDFRRVSAVTDFTVMGNSYGIKGKQTNGMDVLEVYNVVSGEIDRIRRESTPGFLEIRTYRYKGHSMSDPAKYRTRDELEAYREQDPLLLLKTKMLNDGHITEEQFEALDARIKKLCDDAVKFADKSDEPALQSIYDDVFA
ncbi:MAG TPA: pyruvate dehydrogenase (acetyl-transferring) E1 component subunit alpha [Chitinispirillaceae bacterium]|nr:pyruvate dehydrogenase (acetyl-transferring) E1 component subunit alpha [Chitinispirillaceae bacterium]